MRKTIVMRLDPARETKGCHRFMREAGDEGVDTLYLRKRAVDGAAPTTITLTLEG